MKFTRRQYFDLIKEFSVAWFKERDQRTILGFLWSFLNPLIITLILFLIFKKSFSENNYFFLYILIGTICWNYLSATAQSSITVLLWRDQMVKSLIFPNETLIIAQVGVFFIQHLFELLIIILFAMILKIGFSWHILLLPIAIILESAIILGLSLILAVIGVYARDMEYIWGALTRIGFFLVPIFYKIKDLSSKLQLVVKINPVTQIIILYRDILLDHQLPNLFGFGSLVIFSILILIAGYVLFRKYEKKMAERV